jgi:Flp pilus assembly protein TadB
MTAIVCTALICAAVVACYWLYLQAQHAHGRSARTIQVAQDERDASAKVLDRHETRLDEMESRLKRLDVLENARQLKGR